MLPPPGVWSTSLSGYPPRQASSQTMFRTMSSPMQAGQLVPPPPKPFAPVVLTSKGTVGHPLNCADGCKYAKKGRGCKDGADCTRCHLCVWSKLGKKRFA